MSNFVIVPDSSSDMVAALRERFDIPKVVRGTLYHPDGRQDLADVDWSTMSSEEFYDSMKGRNILYKTATPPRGEFIDIFESFLKEGKDILSISLSSSLSGTYQSALSVAEELMEKYPERKIICIDSYRYGSAQTLMVSKAAEMRDSGATLEETADYINKIKHCIHQMGPLDDLFFCVKTGRISNLKAILGTLIGVNSLGDFGCEGLASVIGKVKGHRAALETTVKYVKKVIKNPEEQIIFVGHTNREESAKYLAERIKEEINPKEIIINPIGMSCGSSIGPGLCSAYFLGDPISPNNETEKIAFNEAVAEAKIKK